MPSWDPEAERTASCREFFFFFFTKDSPPGPPPGEGEVHPPSPEAVLFPSGSPVLRPLALPLTARFDGGQDGRGGLPTPSSTAPLLEAAADAVREQGRTQGAALGDEQAGQHTIVI